MHETVDYTDGNSEKPSDYPSVNEKLEKSISVIRTALNTYENPAIMWTGGKDSTLVLYLVHEVVKEDDVEMPPTIFIDHFQHFPETHEFLERWSDKLEVEVIHAKNEDVKNVATGIGEPVKVSDLNEKNKKEVREKLDYSEETFPFLLDTLVGNHLLKTVALNEVLEEYEFDAVLSGIRWDEQESRAKETFFSPRHEENKYPPHDRVHPILQYTEADIWETTWSVMVPDLVEEYPGDASPPRNIEELPHGVNVTDLPISPKYFDGFRSLGSEISTEKTSSEPAWIQNMDDTVERAGRAQDKEGVMNQLRDLGYM